MMRLPRADQAAAQCARRLSLVAAVLAVAPGSAWAGAAPPPTPTPIPAAVANAPGTFHVWSCSTPSGQAAPTDGWAKTASTPLSSTHTDCDAGGALGVNADAAWPAGGTLTWKPAPGVIGLAATIWRTAFASVDRLQNAGGGARATLSVITETSAGELVYGPHDEAAATTTYNAFVGGGPSPMPSDAAVTVDPLSLAGQRAGLAPLKLSATCLGPALTYTCGTRYLMWRADLLLQDPTPPTGALRGPLAGGPGTALSGVASWTVDATDSGTGIRRLAVRVDGVIRATQAPAEAGASCTPLDVAGSRPSYGVMQPCPLSAAVRASLDTTSLNDGAHELQLELEDAAGNTTVVGSGEVLIGNGAQVGPNSPLALRGAANGTPAADAASLRITWPATARAATTKPALRKRCTRSSFAAQHPVTCQGRPAATTLSQAFSATRGATGEVRLTAASGAPIAGATIELQATSTAIGAAASPLPSVTTGPDGRATIDVPLAQGSRTIEGRWRARANDTVPGATAAATLRIAASTSLRAPASVGRGATIAFRGRLDGRAGTLRQVPVRLEVRDGRRWKTFATASTGDDGAWLARLRFARTPGRYLVRATAGTTTTYPYAAGAPGSPITVRVR